MHGKPSHDQDAAKGVKCDAFFEAFRALIGPCDDWDIVTASEETRDGLRLNLDANGLEEKRQLLISRAKTRNEGPKINDQLRFAPFDPEEVAEPNFRIMSAYRVPSAMLFQRTTDLRRFKRPFPNGLELCVALGSSFARDHLHGFQKDKLLHTIMSMEPMFYGHSLYFDYLNALRALLDDPEPKAPDFMKSHAWQAKSCNTVLGGWAQLRHTLGLHIKETVCYTCAASPPPGFVEPEPLFFGRMANLAKRTGQLLEQAGAFGAPSIALSKSHFSWSLKGIIRWFEDAFTPGDIPEVLREGPYEPDLKALWRSLGEICRELEEIASKQLEGVALIDTDDAFSIFQWYGESLARIMLYGGNSYFSPRDDAPRIIDVYTNPGMGHLHVGIARSRRVYVLYPWQGRNILCEGAILPYYEFVNKHRLTNSSWKKRLDSAARPAIPQWIQPAIWRQGISKPDQKKEH